eukprot:m.108948 g.108948  ORF g.108948 m.108948 type:complete len:552 (+) comp13986_c1_seq1:117-1772(+)
MVSRICLIYIWVYILSLPVQCKKCYTRTDMEVVPPHGWEGDPSDFENIQDLGSRVVVNLGLPKAGEERLHTFLETIAGKFPDKIAGPICHGGTSDGKALCDAMDTARAKRKPMLSSVNTGCNSFSFLGTVCTDDDRGTALNCNQSCMPQYLMFPLLVRQMPKAKFVYLYRSKKEEWAKDIMLATSSQYRKSLQNSFIPGFKEGTPDSTLSFIRWVTRHASLIADTMDCLRTQHGTELGYLPFDMDNDDITKLLEYLDLPIETKSLFPAPSPKTPILPNSKPKVEYAYVGKSRTDVLCDVPCKGSSPVRSATMDGQVYPVTYSMESSKYYGRLEMKKSKLNTIYATVDMKSQVPVPYFTWSGFLQAVNVHADMTKQKPIGMFMARNCHSTSGREKIVKALIKHKMAHSVSGCLHNYDVKSTLPRSSNSFKVDIMSQYMFYYAFENSIQDDYFTEKLWGPLIAGTIPVVYSASNVKEYVPKNSIVFVKDFTDAKQLADYLQDIARNETLWRSYHAWRDDPFTVVSKKYNLLHRSFVCRVCEHVYKKEYRAQLV